MSDKKEKTPDWLQEGAVSLWIGRAESEDSFNEYLKLDYTEDGDLIPSVFMKGFGIDHYDEDFQEATFHSEDSRSLADLLAGNSYGEQILPHFIRLCGEPLPEEVNAVVLLYNFRYTGESRVHAGPRVNLRYVGAGTYSHKAQA